MTDAKAVEYKTVVFELSTNNLAIVADADLDLDSALAMLSRDGWEVVTMTGGLGGTVSGQRKGVVLLQRRTT